MQIPKKTIKSKIVKASMEEFLLYGYASSSMRNIATQSGITVGNIYSYFSGKEDLFDYLLADTVADLQKLLEMKVENNGVLSSQSILEMAHFISEVFQKNRIQFLILMDGSLGSKYQNIKSELITQASARIISESQRINPDDESIDPVLAKSIAVSLIEGMIFLFKKSGKDKKRLEKLLGDFLTVVMGDFFKHI